MKKSKFRYNSAGSIENEKFLCVPADGNGATRASSVGKFTTKELKAQIIVKKKQEKDNPLNKFWNSGNVEKPPENLIDKIQTPIAYNAAKYVVKLLWKENYQFAKKYLFINW